MYSVNSLNAIEVSKVEISKCKKIVLEINLQTNEINGVLFSYCCFDIYHKLVT